MASLDTSISGWMSFVGDPAFTGGKLEKLDELEARGEILATTCFTVAELYVGVELSRQRPERPEGGRRIVGRPRNS